MATTIGKTKPKLKSMTTATKLASNKGKNKSLKTDSSSALIFSKEDEKCHRPKTPGAKRGPKKSLKKEGSESAAQHNSFFQDQSRNKSPKEKGLGFHFGNPSESTYQEQDEIGGAVHSICQKALCWDKGTDLGSSGCAQCHLHRPTDCLPQNSCPIAVSLCRYPDPPLGPYYSSDQSNALDFDSQWPIFRYCSEKENKGPSYTGTRIYRHALRKDLSRIQKCRERTTSNRKCEQLVHDTKAQMSYIKQHVQNEVAGQICTLRNDGKATISLFLQAQKDVSDGIETLSLYLQELSTRLAVYEAGLDEAERSIRDEADMFIATETEKGKKKLLDQLEKKPFHPCT